MKILLDRVSQCAVEEGPNAKANCRGLVQEYEMYVDEFEKKCKLKKFNWLTSTSTHH